MGGARTRQAAGGPIAILARLFGRVGLGIWRPAGRTQAMVNGIPRNGTIPAFVPAYRPPGLFEDGDSAAAGNRLAAGSGWRAGFLQAAHYKPNRQPPGQGF